MSNIPIEKQISQAVRCLVVEGKLEDFEDELTMIVTAIYACDCGFVCSTTLTSSELSQTPHNPDNRPVMKVGTRDRKNPLDIVWSMLHEYGHLLQGSRALQKVMLDNTLEYPREKDAWDKAEIELAKYPRFVAGIADFFVYRDFALSTYNR